MRPDRNGTHLRAAALAALVLLLLSSPAAAQTVVGRAVDGTSLDPLQGAFVVLEDSAGVRHDEVLTRPNGRFVLRASRPGTYRAVVQMIGYATTRTDFFDLGPGETLVRDIEARVQAISLEGIEVEGEARCRARPGSGTGAEHLWEEARKALELARWSESQGMLRFHIVEHRRELDARTLVVTAESESRRSGLTDRSPYASIPAEDLEEAGYIQVGQDGQYEYYAPDADVLLSDSFVRAHCFRVVAPPASEPELIGLGFEPVPGRDVPEIEGTLWLEQGTAELRRLDFRYRDLPPPYPEWPEVGGRVEFRRLSTGAWIIPRWYIRMPYRASRMRGRGGTPGELVLETLSEKGARVARVRTADGEVLAEAAGATLYGTVTDGDGDPLADVEVRLSALGRTAVTGPDGAYRLTDLPEGSFEARVLTPEGQLIGAPPEERTVTLAGGQALRLPVELASQLELAREACARYGGEGEEAPADSPVLLYGVVRAPDGETAVARGLVRIEIDGGERRVSADSAGVYRICLEPTTAALRMAAALSGSELERHPLESLEPVGVDAREPGLARVDPTLPPTVIARREAPSDTERWSNSVFGTVREEGSGRPISNAVVTLADSTGTALRSMLTDTTGWFRLLHPDVRVLHYTLVVEHPDHRRATRPLEFEPAEELEIEVILGRREPGDGPGP